jgi:hypothetical protein
MVEPKNTALIRITSFCVTTVLRFLFLLEQNKRDSD